MKKAYVILVVLLMSVVGYAQKTDATDLVDSISTIEFRVYLDVSKMKKKFARFFERTSKQSLKMVNPGDTFNFSDLKSSAPADKRLIFLGEGRSNTGVIVYQQGGNAQQYFCIIYKKSGRAYSYQLIRLNESVTGIQELREVISKDGFTTFASYPH